MARTLFITKDEIKTCCISGGTNYDGAKIKESAIEAAQNDYFKPVIGKDLFNELIEQKEAGNLTDANEALIEKFKDALCWYTLLMLGPLIFVEITTKGLQLNNSEFSSSATNKDRADTYDTLKRMGDSFKNTFVEWIEDEDNIDTYPLYVNGDDVNETTPIQGGMLLDHEEESTYE